MWKSGRRARGRCSTFERKGRHDAYVRLNEPLLPVRSEGFPIPGPRSPRSLELPVRTHPLRFALRPAVLIALGESFAACPAAPSPRQPAPPDAPGALTPAETATPAPSASAPPAFPVTITDDEGTKIQLAE